MSINHIFSFQDMFFKNWENKLYDIPYLENDPSYFEGMKMLIFQILAIV